MERLQKCRLMLVALLIITQVATIGALHSGEAKRPALHAEQGQILDQEMVARFVDWIISKTGWVEKGLPTITFASPAQLNKRYFGKPRGSNGVTVRALYAKQTHTIYLSDAWNPNNLRDQSYLVHELVHHLQILNKVEVGCDSAYNIRAYQLQFDWLDEHGVRDPQKFLGIGDIVLITSTQCPLFRACEFLLEGCPK